MNANQSSKINVLVDGEWEKRDIWYARYDGNQIVHYPVLKKYEHIFESRDGLRVFTSVVQ